MATESIPRKQCSRKENCTHPEQENDGWLPATTEYFMVHKGQLYCQCHICRKEAKRQSHVRNRGHNNARSQRWAEEHREEVNQRNRDRMKTDSDYAEHIRALGRDSYARNQPERRARARRIYWSDPVKAREQKRRDYRKHKDKRRVYFKIYRTHHLDEHRESNRLYDQRHPEVGRAKAARRRARKKTLPIDFTKENERFALDYFEHKCAICGRGADFWTVITMDHWIAASKGGGYTRANLVPICHSRKDGCGTCNESKQDKSPLIWLTERYGKRKAKQIIQRIEEYFAVVDADSRTAR